MDRDKLWRWMGFPGHASGKESVGQCRRHKRHGFDPWVRKIPWYRKWQPTLVFPPGKFHGQRSLAGYGPWDHKVSDTTEPDIHTRWIWEWISGSRDENLGKGVTGVLLLDYRGAQWATVHRATKGQTWLKDLAHSIHLTIWVQLHCIHQNSGREDNNEANWP